MVFVVDPLDEEFVPLDTRNTVFVEFVVALVVLEALVALEILVVF